MRQFSGQIVSILAKLPELSNLVQKPQFRSVMFSSGQNIKPITLCRYEFFQLIYHCLMLSREFPEYFVVDMDRVNVFSIVEVYRVAKLAVLEVEPVEQPGPTDAVEDSMPAGEKQRQVVPREADDQEQHV